jgi:murein DD-endopeptidase MepM/ murein hydrolase activator NlpD
VRRVERAEGQVEQAREHLPTKRRLSFQPEVEVETGRTRRRLHFEQEVLPEYRKPSLPARAGGMAKTAAVMKLHGKIHESERQNVAVEATHKSELFAEQGVGRVLRWQRNRRRSKPYRALRQAEQRAAKEHLNLAWQTALRDNPELRNKNVLAKWIQKQKMKRKYAQAAHEAKQTAHFTQNVVHATGQIVRAVQQYIAARKSLLLVVAMLAMVVVFFSAGMTSCTAMLSGFQSSYISASYMANEQDICNSDLYYTEMETDLQMDIDQTEENYPGYDEYRYNIGEISHNPYELMGYLSTVFNAFTFEQVQAELARLFGEQYSLTREVIVETRYDSDGDPYDWYVLQTTLTVTPLSTIISGTLSPGEQTDRYNVYQQTLGNRQAYGNPFDFPWLGYVSSSYGYRVHPISGEKNLHRGVDIAVAQGTPIRAIHDGRVVSAGDAGSYGLCVVIEDEKGYQSRYAHCSSLSVSAGQEVKRGDVIAAVGSTGNSTGPHLHLEIMLNGEYLNPYYFVDTGYDGSTAGAIPGTPGGVEIPAYPGEPVTDETYAAMLEEAQKYLGYPYVWGGSSPSTSFDCSGFVSWVINHSGWNVGRLGAQGLYNICTPVSMANAQPGDLIFFWHTYDAPNPNGVTHVGIYVGNGQMIHCGNPISYANINSNYWQQHFYGMGRLP